MLPRWKSSPACRGTAEAGIKGPDTQKSKHHSDHEEPQTTTGMKFVGLALEGLIPHVPMVLLGERCLALTTRKDHAGQDALARTITNDDLGSKIKHEIRSFCFPFSSGCGARRRNCLLHRALRKAGLAAPSKPLLFVSSS